MNDRALRSELIRVGKQLEAMNLNRGASGNISVRCGEGMLVSPSGLGVGGLTLEDIVFVDAAGRSHGARAPSSEWLFHRDILAAHPEFGAVVHTHSVAATTLACLRKEIPAIHYMILMAGGDNIPCTGYATFGTQALSDMAVAALKDRKACLLANHGVIAVGKTLEEAAHLAGEVEMLATLYLQALQIGEPVLLTREDLQAARRQFEALRYGEQSW